MSEAFRASYNAACDEEKIRACAPVIAACDSGTQVLHCNGNSQALRNKRLLDVDCKVLAKALQYGHPFVVLDLSYNNLGRGAAESLAALLYSDSSIQVLDLSANDFDEMAAEVLCNALKTNTTVQELKLSGNAILGSGGMFIAELLQSGSSIRRLYLNNCCLDTASLVSLATVCHKHPVAILDVGRPLLMSPLMEEATDHFARTLAANTSLVDLNLSKCSMLDRGLMLLANGLLRAKGRASLHTLRLGSNSLRLIDTECVESLSELLAAPFCSLTSLELDANPLHDIGALVLAEILQANTSLVRLGLSYDKITSRGLCALGPTLASHQTLQEVAIWGNSFDSAACSAWRPACAALKLDISVQDIDGAFFCVRS